MIAEPKGSRQDLCTAEGTLFIAEQLCETFFQIETPEVLGIEPATPIAKELLADRLEYFLINLPWDENVIPTMGTVPPFSITFALPATKVSAQIDARWKRIGAVWIFEMEHALFLGIKRWPRCDIVRPSAANTLPLLWFRDQHSLELARAPRQRRH